MPPMRGGRCRTDPGRGTAVPSEGMAVHGSAQERGTGRDRMGISLLWAVGGGQEWLQRQVGG